MQAKRQVGWLVVRLARLVAWPGWCSILRGRTRMWGCQFPADPASCSMHGARPLLFRWKAMATPTASQTKTAPVGGRLWIRKITSYRFSW